jgi:hypothetical protein
MRLGGQLGAGGKGGGGGFGLGIWICSVGADIGWYKQSWKPIWWLDMDVMVLALVMPGDSY